MSNIRLNSNLGDTLIGVAFFSIAYTYTLHDDGLNGTTDQAIVTVGFACTVFFYFWMLVEMLRFNGNLRKVFWFFAFLLLYVIAATAFYVMHLRPFLRK